MIRFFGGKVLALNGNFDITNDEVWIDANKIVYVGPKKDVEKFEREINLNGNLLMPTFKNAHTHSAMTSATICRLINGLMTRYSLLRQSLKVRISINFQNSHFLNI